VAARLGSTTGRPANITVYRIEGVPNTRILLGEGGKVIIVGENMLFLNFGSRARAEAFLAKRVAQGMEGAAVKSFEVPKTVLEALRAIAVPERLKSQFPNRPLIVDPTKAPDQFGLRAAQIELLQKLIVQGTGKVSQ
jgi:filamentous hemagglutinin